MKKPALVVRHDYSHLPVIRETLKEMRKVCREKMIENPVDVLVPEDGLLDNMPAEMLEQSIVLCAWPGVDVRIGGPEGKIQEGVGSKGRVLIFHDRRHTITAAIQIMQHVIKKMKGEISDAPNLTQ